MKRHWLRNKIRQWLGLDNSLILSDLAMNTHSTIVIATKIDGGRVKIINTRFKSVSEYNKAIADIQRAFQISDNDTIQDVPRFRL